MVPILLDFAKCKCGHRTSIRPTNFAPTETDPRWSKMDTEPLIVACSVCRLVSSFLPRELEEIGTEMGVAPYTPKLPCAYFEYPSNAMN